MNKGDVLQALARHIGAHQGITARDLVIEISGQSDPHRGDQRRLRQLITELRMEGHHVCAHPSTGYFIARDEAELNRTCAYLEERAMASLAQVSRMKRTSLPDLLGQLRLPT
ncbi:hypothetical protein [Sedimenticola hydrogenitrophicus]|uniref:hypothetical protein n=1 Tax=Sedimenticola hydrogenitrophicus TaxID=2967975 RepID=UPI0023B0E0DC|nr:hypothetical protein [Sedimenticola hydrogenitrophicus]